MTRVFIPADAAAIALGADGIARVLAATVETRKLNVEIVRTGSRGLHWLEPLIEVETQHGRIGYGPIKAPDIPALIDAGLLEGKPHPTCIGNIDEHPWLIITGTAYAFPQNSRGLAYQFRSATPVFNDHRYDLIQHYEGLADRPSLVSAPIPGVGFGWCAAGRVEDLARDHRRPHSPSPASGFWRCAGSRMRRDEGYASRTLTSQPPNRASRSAGPVFVPMEP